MVVSVRHAQDVELERFEGEWDWATATFHIRSLVETEVASMEVIFDGELPTQGERLSLGDADGEVVLPCPSTRTRVIIATDRVDPTGLQHIWVDLIGAGD